MKGLASQIYAAVKSGRLKEPFNAAAVKRACPGRSENTFRNFLSKHAIGNGETTELFERVARGLYRIIQRPV